VRPFERRGAWRPETASRRLGRCLGFLRAGDFVTAKEQERILRRAKKWRAKHALPSLTRRRQQVTEAGARPSEMRDTIEEKFRAYHAANPGVYAALVKLTRAQFLRGATRHGLKAMFEQLRFRIATGKIGRPEVRATTGYEFDNDFTSRYVRLLVTEYPAYRGLFELRHLRSP